MVAKRRGRYGRWGLLSVWAGLVVLLIAGCASVPRQMNFADLRARALPAGLESVPVMGELFTLAALAPAEAQSGVLRVYIEGDGLAWRTRNRLSAHPSPVNPTALNLMLADPSHNKAYLARPCQYMQTEACHPRYWSTHPFSEEVIAEMNRALDILKERGGYTRLELVGFSGGGAVAVLLAARRDDIDGLTTVAGNLDTDALCRLHGVTPLSGSLNPADFADALGGISQRHFIGKEDRVVPAAIYASFAGHLPPGQAVSPIVVAGAGHQKGWEELWPSLLRHPGVVIRP